MHRSLPGLAFRAGNRREIGAALAEEVAIALVYDGSTQAVMMATPADLEDFATGFSLSEGIVSDPAQIESLEVIRSEAGIELQMWLAKDQGTALGARRRTQTGPVGCGLCGIDSLAQAMRPVPRVGGEDLRLDPSEAAAAPQALRGSQPLHDQTRAAHAAGFLVPGQGIRVAREDVGRHNALDKLIGALARQGIDPATGAAVMTSRVSIDIVQKCAVAGIPALISVSAPTAQAVELAESAGMTLAVRARDEAFECFAGARRLIPRERSHVA